MLLKALFEDGLMLLINHTIDVNDELGVQSEANIVLF